MLLYGAILHDNSGVTMMKYEIVMNDEQLKLLADLLAPYDNGGDSEIELLHGMIVDTLQYDSSDGQQCNDFTA